MSQITISKEVTGDSIAQPDEYYGVAAVDCQVTIEKQVILPEPYIEIGIRSRDIDTKIGIPNDAVYVNGVYKGITSSDGYLKFKSQPGIYDISFSHADYGSSLADEIDNETLIVAIADWKESVTYPTNGVITLEKKILADKFTYYRGGILVIICSVDIDTDEPIANDAVFINGIYRGVTSADGCLKVRLLPGSYEINFSNDNYYDSSGTLTVTTSGEFTYFREEKWVAKSFTSKVYHLYDQWNGSEYAPDYRDYGPQWNETTQVWDCISNYDPDGSLKTYYWIFNGDWKTGYRPTKFRFTVNGTFGDLYNPTDLVFAMPIYINAEQTAIYSAMESKVSPLGSAYIIHPKMEEEMSTGTAFQNGGVGADLWGVQGLFNIEDVNPYWLNDDEVLPVTPPYVLQFYDPINGWFQPIYYEIVEQDPNIYTIPRIFNLFADTWATGFRPKAIRIYEDPPNTEGKGGFAVFDTDMNFIAEIANGNDKTAAYFDWQYDKDIYMIQLGWGWNNRSVYRIEFKL